MPLGMGGGDRAKGKQGSSEGGGARNMYNYPGMCPLQSYISRQAPRSSPNRRKSVSGLLLVESVGGDTRALKGGGGSGDHCGTASV